MTARFTESTVESAALGWLGALGYAVLHGPDIAAGEPAAERSDPNYRDVVLEGRLRQALVRLNPDLPNEALEDAYRKLTRVNAPSLVERNRALHRMLVDGVTVEYRHPDGRVAGAQARVIDFDAPANNDWLAVNQFTVSEGQHTRRPDVVPFVNGLPLAVIELKNPSDENATIWSAWQQFQTRPIRHRFPRSLSPTPRWSFRTAWRHASARSARARSGSSPGARSPGARTRRLSSPSCRWSVASTAPRDPGAAWTCGLARLRRDRRADGRLGRGVGSLAARRRRWRAALRLGRDRSSRARVLLTKRELGRDGGEACVRRRVARRWGLCAAGAAREKRGATGGAVR